MLSDVLVMRVFLLGLLGGAGLFCVACDTAPGPSDPDAHPPVVSDLSYAPQAVLVDQLPPSQIVNGAAQVSLSLQVSVRDEDGDLAAVQFVVQPPGLDSTPVAAGDLQAQGGSVYTATVPLSLPIAAVGNYTVVVYATDATGQLGNEVLGTLSLVASGGPPVIEQVEMPDRVQRPAPGQPPVLIPIIATVSDPDGLANIARVAFTPQGGTAIQLCDDGPEVACGGVSDSGDAVAGDGRFTITVQLENTNAPGVRTFDFQATDRTGLTSNVVMRTITVD
jgi:hypothetical protein